MYAIRSYYEKIYMSNAVSTSVTYENLLKTIKSQNKKIIRAKAGMTIIKSDDLLAEIIAPNKEEYNEVNNYSIVVKLTYNDNSFLFMGDAEALSENEIRITSYNVCYTKLLRK